MPISEAALVALAEQIEEHQARDAVLYDALEHARRIAKKALLPGGDHEEALRHVMDVALHAKRLVDSLINAGFLRGQEIADEETMTAFGIAGSFHHLTPEGKIRYCAARKRASARESKSLRDHGADLLRLTHEAERAALSLTPDTDD